MTYQLLTYSGIPRTGDIIEVNVSDSNGNSKTVSYTVLIGNDNDAIVAALAALISDANFTPVIYNGSSFYVTSPNNYVVTATSSVTITSAQTIDAYTWSFNEKRNAYCSFYDYHPEWITSAEDVMYSWVRKRGKA